MVLRSGNHPPSYHPCIISMSRYIYIDPDVPTWVKKHQALIVDHINLIQDILFLSGHDRYLIHHYLVARTLSRHFSLAVTLELTVVYSTSQATLGNSALKRDRKAPDDLSVAAFLLE